VPDLHALAKTYALGDAYSTGTQPPSGPNHWWLFSGQSASSSQQQSYPAATGTQFDRFLKGPSGGDPFIMPAMGSHGGATADGQRDVLAGRGFAVAGLVLGLVILALLPVMPFTEQFARESTPKAYWGSPTFKKINRVLSAGWGTAIFAIGVSRATPE